MKIIYPIKLIYDTELYSSLSKKNIFRGLNDSFAHCLESLYSFNKNIYSNFVGISSINMFIKNVIDNKIKYNSNFLFNKFIII